VKARVSNFGGKNKMSQPSVTKQVNKENMFYNLKKSKSRISVTKMVLKTWFKNLLNGEKS
jgi:hypothetical protein